MKTPDINPIFEMGEENFQEFMNEYNSYKQG